MPDQLQLQRQTSADPAPGRTNLTNMALCLGTLESCRDVGPGAPRMGLFYGFSGYGKTISAAFAAAQTGAIYIPARSNWSVGALLRAIAHELGIARMEKRGPDLLDQICKQLNHTPADLIIDEMDNLAKRPLVEIIRDIHDATQIAILMIGEEALPLKLKEWERFDNRILVATAAQPATPEDARRLRDLYCTRIHVADDLAEHFRTRTRAVARRIVVNLQAAQRLAAEAGLSAIDLAWWGDRPVYTGEAPVRRKVGA